VKRFDRSQRVADAIQRIVAEALQGEIKDFDMSRVTVTRCEVTRDLSEATVSYSVLGSDDHRRVCASQLSKVAGFLQRRIGDGLSLRQTPHLHFKYDESVVEAARLDELFNQIERERSDGE
jgi:ribosome-binding factor A